jgi:hypothetical protein
LGLQAVDQLGEFSPVQLAMQLQLAYKKKMYNLEVEELTLPFTVLKVLTRNKE